MFAEGGGLTRLGVGGTGSMFGQVWEEQISCSFCLSITQSAPLRFFHVQSAPFFINEWHCRGLRSHAFKTCFHLNACVCVFVEGSWLLPQSSFILFSWLHCLVVCLMSGLSSAPDKPTQDGNSTVAHSTMCVGSLFDWNRAMIRANKGSGTKETLGQKERETVCS